MQTCSHVERTSAPAHMCHCAVHVGTPAHMRQCATHYTVRLAESVTTGAAHQRTCASALRGVYVP
ncbi:hypothetical protein FKP32DRAFT_1136334 [Trametes sanguinea]|nr:hypothetical protein FKP32DRAFT_1136334 [Trametes sanguinea]